MLLVFLLAGFALPRESRLASARYWECFNLVDDACNDSMAITAFKMGLHPNSALRSSLTRRPPKTVWGLMKKVEELRRALSGCSLILKAVMAMESL